MSVITDNYVQIFQLMTIKSAMDLERLGMRHSSGKSAHSLAKNILGIKGNRQKIYNEFCKYLAEAKGKVPPKQG